MVTCVDASRGAGRPGGFVRKHNFVRVVQWLGMGIDRGGTADLEH